MFVKIAFGNIRRSLSDYSVYFFALALAACLLYSFTGSFCASFAVVLANCLQSARCCRR